MKLTYSGDKSMVKQEQLVKKPLILNKAVIALGIFLIALLISYFSLSIFFMNHFQFNTKINGEDVSLKNVDQVEPLLKKLIASYNLTIVGSNNIEEQISGESISAEINENEKTVVTIKKQEAFLWPLSIFQNSAKKVDIEITYDEDKLEQEIAGLNMVSGEAISEEDAKPKFDGENYIIASEVYGTTIDQEKLTEKVKEYIGGLETTLDVEKESCYIEPRYTTDSEEVQAACDVMNKYVQSSITYTTPEPVIIDKTLISQWIFTDANMNVHFNRETIKNWLREIGKKYDTVGTTRTFTTPTGKEATVSGGTYGWSVDESTEYNNIIDSIQAGESTTKDLTYNEGQVAVDHAMPDWGSTYIEVDLTVQHMWYIKDGSVVFESDVVTGLPTSERETPQGVYSILDKRLNYTLTGSTDPATGQPIYKTPVNYWMRVTWTGIGFHDANWQSSFGGSRYLSNGSHGCINMPAGKASELYNLIENGNPVVMHY